MSDSPRFLGIGDTVIDAFIDLQDATVACDANGDYCLLQMRFGDKIPYRALNVVKGVGNSANASVSAARLGLQSSLVTYFGKDDHGQQCIKALQDNGVSTDYVEIQDGFATNYHFVLSYEAERTILINHAEFDYSWQRITSQFVQQPDWIYFSSLAENSLPFHHELAQWVADHPETKLVFQPGTFQIKLGAKELADVYRNSELFFCNKEEAQRILETDQADMKELLKMIHALGPNIVCLTDGPDGAFAYDGNEGWFVPMYPDPAPPVERTGAGDSFSSTFTVFRAKGMSIKDCLLRGPINSMNVVQHIGAQAGLLPEDQIEDLLSKAPEHYVATQVI